MYLLKSLRENYALSPEGTSESSLGNKLFALYQGTTLVVPKGERKIGGFSPCAFSMGNSCVFCGGGG